MTIGGEYDQDVKDKDGTIKEFKDATGFYYNDMYNHDTYTCNKRNSNVEDRFSSEIVCIDIGKDGVETHVPISLDGEELAALRCSAETLRKILDECKLGA